MLKNQLFQAGREEGCRLSANLGKKLREQLTRKLALGIESEN